MGPSQASCGRRVSRRPEPRHGQSGFGLGGIVVIRMKLGIAFAALLEDLIAPL